MGLWDKLKQLFSDPPPPSGPQPTPQESKDAQTATKAEAKRGVRLGPKATGTLGRPDVLGLSAEELRKRALKIVPWRTAWIGRTDLIPPVSDDRTAYIDALLIQNGALNEPELAEIHRVGDLWLQHRHQAEAARVVAQKAGQDAVAALKAEKAQKKAEKQAAAQLRKENHARQVAHNKATDIVYLGRGVSGWLADRRANVERLDQRGLPRLATPADVAAFLGLRISDLRWLAFHSEVAERTHYVSFRIPKRSGGERILSAPHPRLKAVQRQLLRGILEKLDPGPLAHGFVTGRSTVTNAQTHVGQRVVVNLDLKDFFPTVSFVRVRGLFKGLGYSPAVATVLALLTTEAPRVPIEYDGQKYHAATSSRVLPQGAPTSPAISNLVARKLDARLFGLAQKHGWQYTRYADDLTFSTRDATQGAPWLIRQVEKLIRAEGFVVHPQKRRTQRRGGRQTVTGIVVNDRLSVPREELRTLRAILHNAQKTGLEAQNRQNVPHFEAHLRGRIAYVAMVEPAKGAKLLAALARVSAG